MIFDTILVGYKPDNTSEALELCNGLLRFQRIGRRVLVLNDASAASSLDSRATRRWEIVRGSNTLGEFSGWQEGLDHLKETGRGAFFANDSLTVHRKFTSARRHALRRALNEAASATIVGFRDRAAGHFAVNGLRFDSWVRTYCFGLTHEALRLLSYKICDAEIAARCVHGGLAVDRFFSHLSPDLDARLQQNLFEGGWYASEPLSAGSVARLSFKARCIVLEKWLAARCSTLRVKEVDPFLAYPLLERIDRAQSRPFGAAAMGVWRTVLRSLGRQP